MSAPVRRFGVNPEGRDLIVGDIHGHFTKLAAELSDIGFNPDAGDRLFSVGDLVDRGPESHLALDWLDKDWFEAVAGNHEDYAIRWPKGHMSPGEYAANGGAWNIGNTPPERIMFADAFSALPIAIELETDAGLVGIVHADCPCSSWQEFTALLEDPTLSNNRRKAVKASAQWSRNRADKLFSDGVAGVRAVVVGHTPMREWSTLGNVYFIDTYGWRGGKFCILDANTLRPASKPGALQW